jgi:hypothetical protein
VPAPATADEVVSALTALRSPDELPKVRSRLAPAEDAIGLRMRDLFATAKAATGLPLDQVDRLLDHPAYEPRMAAFCILDFKARRRLDDDGRRALHDLYLRRHDRITTWDMVDRSAPRVVGGWLAGRSTTPLDDLAGSDDPLRRRTAITAPLFFVAAGSDDDLAAGFALADRLAADPDPLVHKAVGIFLKHAGSRDPEALHRLLSARADEMARPAVRLAVEKLPPEERARYVG